MMSGVGMKGQNITFQHLSYQPYRPFAQNGQAGKTFETDVFQFVYFLLSLPLVFSALLGSWPFTNVGSVLEMPYCKEEGRVLRAKASVARRLRGEQGALFHLPEALSLGQSGSSTWWWRPLSLFIYQIPLLTCSKLEGGGPGYKEPSSVAPV